MRALKQTLRKGGETVSDETGLIRKIQKNASRKAADLLVRKYYQEIYVYVYRQIGNREDAMDLTQEIFISVLSTIRYYDPKKSSFRTWLYRIATNKVIDHRRSNKPIWQSLEDMEPEIADPRDAAVEFQNSQLLSDIEDFVSGADDSSQMIFRLHIYDDATFKDIAEVMNLSENTVKTKYYRLQNQIRKEFGDHEL